MTSRSNNRSSSRARWLVGGGREVKDSGDCEGTEDSTNSPNLSKGADDHSDSL